MWRDDSGHRRGWGRRALASALRVPGSAAPLGLARGGIEALAFLGFRWAFPYARPLWALGALAAWAAITGLRGASACGSGAARLYDRGGASRSGTAFAALFVLARFLLYGAIEETTCALPIALLVCAAVGGAAMGACGAFAAPASRAWRGVLVSMFGALLAAFALLFVVGVSALGWMAVALLVGAVAGRLWRWRDGMRKADARDAEAHAAYAATASAVGPRQVDLSTAQRRARTAQRWAALAEAVELVALLLLASRIGIHLL